MKISIAIYGGPYSSQASHSALHFARAALAGGHELYRLFFYQDGVYNSNVLIQPPQDEDDLHQQWTDLARDNDIEMVVCVASALRRGMMDQTESDRYEKTQHVLQAPFVISGLGQLIEAGIQSDRLVTFGV